MNGIAVADVNAIIDQRDQLLQILMQRDITIELLLSKAKISNADGELRETNVSDVNAQNVQDYLDKTNNNASSIHKSINSASAANVQFEQMKLQCGLLADLNDSLKKENESLKVVNESLHERYKTFQEHLQRVQSEHRRQIEQLCDCSSCDLPVTSRSRTVKRVRANSRNDGRDLQNKRPRITRDGSGDSSTSIDEGSDRSNPPDNDEEDDDDDDDVLFVE